MDKTFSIYLDLVRFLAAVMIFLGHSSYSRFSGGIRILWRLETLGSDTVMVFFVLSGVVIAYVSDQKEKTLEEYSISRLARLYSVVIPALLLTIVLDYFGPYIAYEGYDGPWFTTSNPLWRFFANLFFVNEVWFSSVEAFSNWPFWSLGYEFWYYAIFGVAYYVKPSCKYYIVVLIGLIVGPKVLLLFPVWLLGVWVYFINKSRPVSEPIGWILAVGTITLYALFQRYNWPDRLQSLAVTTLGGTLVNDDLKKSAYFLSRYVAGLLIALHFIGIASVLHRFERTLDFIENAIRHIAGYTFSIYLFHYPLLYFFSAVANKFVYPPLRSLFFMIATCAAIWILGMVTERNKTHLKRCLISWRSKIILISKILQPDRTKALGVVRRRQ